MAFALALVFAFLIAGLLGSKRKIGFGWSLVACIFTSPIIGLIITLCSEKLPEEQETAELEEEKPLAEVLTESGVAVAETNTGPSVQEEQPTTQVKDEDSTPIDY